MKIFTIEQAWKLGHFLFLILLGLSVFYALERVCYMDSAFMFFRMVNDEKLIAEGGRYIHVIPQFLPWLMVKLNAPLHLIIVSFSFLYTACFYLAYIIIGKLMKQKVIAVIFLFLLLISVNETFFDVVTETKFSLAFACLFLAHLLREKQASIYIGILMLVFGFYTHPIFVVYCAIIIFFISLYKFNRHLLIYGGVIMILLVSKALIFGSTTYEKELLSATFYNPFQLLKNSFIHTYFGGLLGTQFIVLICIIFLQLFSLLKSKKWLLLSMYFMAMFLLYIALALVYSKGDSHMMIQKTLLVFHFILLIPFVLLEKTMSVWVQRSVYFLIILGCFWALWSTNTLAKKYTNRVAVLEHFLKKLPKQSDKYLISENQINHEVMMGTWALPHESILVSKIKFKNPINLKNFRERNDTLFLSQFPNGFRPAFGLPLLNSELNTTYFEMDESKKVLWLDSTYILGKN